MARLSNRMTRYEAPEGYVYDWAKPKDDKSHLYVKFLFRTKICKNACKFFIL